MADSRLLDWANAAERLAKYCEGIEAELKSIDITIDAETGRFWPWHRGETPAALRSNYNGWKDSLVEGLPHLENVIARCYREAKAWRNEYQRQKDREEEEEEARKRQAKN